MFASTRANRRGRRLAALPRSGTRSARQFEGLGVQVGGTAVLLSASRRGLPYVKELDAIMENILTDAPLLLANWKSASHIHQPPRRATHPDDGSASGSGSETGGSGPTPPSGS